jgi:hypothetical protein
VHRTSTSGIAINTECIRRIDGPAYSESIDLSRESLYFHLQITILLNLIDASFLGDSGRFIPTTRKIPLL